MLSCSAFVINAPTGKLLARNLHLLRSLSKIQKLNTPQITSFDSVNLLQVDRITKTITLRISGKNVFFEIERSENESNSFYMLLMD